MPFEKRVPLAGSMRSPVTGAQEVGAVDPNEMVRVSVFLGRKDKQPIHNAGRIPERMERSSFAAQLGADAGTVAKIEAFAHHSGLTVVESNPAKRRVVLAGPAEMVTRAFGATVATYRMSSGASFRARTGSLTIPTELAADVVAVLGLDARPIARPHFRRRRKRASTPSFTPPQVAALYNYPSKLTGSGQSVAIIELGGGYTTSDLSAYFKDLNITEPSVTAVSVDGAANSPGSEADGEVMLDIEVIGSVAPGASIAVYFAPNTEQGFTDAITDAVHDATHKPSVISISWGGPEDSWSQQAQTAMNAALEDAGSLGVTVTVAAGDGGSSDGSTDGKLHVDFPAASPYALACGGTKLVGSGSKISSEVVWNETSAQEGATGGGVSTVFALPSYQSSVEIPPQPQTSFVGRGVPDVSGNADPSTGYTIRVNGSDEVIGGTSAVAPLWAALIALMNQQLTMPAGFLNPKLYPLAESVFRDITSGNNDDSGLGYYDAGKGWDACTGLGSPDGTALLAALGPL